ncbi:MAG: AsmA family protein [Gammaproteobacteria bacterium]|nr:AsmA family protein [Gammaproteobacteria bacterium]MCW8923067.1 AsmA family protein [Gammaproteobacteria bacterium]
MKKALVVILVLLLLTIVTAATFIYTFDANQYKEEIAHAIGELTNRPVSISGDVEISVYPWIGVKLNQVSIKNKAGFSKTNFATVGQFDISVKISPLLDKQLDVDRLVLHRLVVDYEKNKAGENNWSDFAAGGKDENILSKFGIAGLAIGGIEMTDASFSWFDASTNKKFEVSKIGLDTEEIIKGQPLPISLKAYIESNQPEWRSAVSVKTNLEFTDDPLVFNANGIKLKAKAAFPGSNINKLSFAMISDSKINLHDNKAKLDNTKFSLFGLVMSGSFDVDNIFSVPVIEGPLKVKKFSAEKLAKKFEISIPAMVNDQSLKNISMTVAFKSDFTNIYLDNLFANIDKSRVNGFVHITVDEQTTVKYKLDVNNVVLDDYKTVEVGSNDEIALPLDLIRSVNLEGSFDVEKAMIDDIEVTSFHVDSEIRDGVIKANPITMWLGESELRAAMELDARATPLGKFTVAVKNVDAKAGINPLLKTVLGNEDIFLEGAADIDINIRTKGTSISEQKSLAKGKAKVSMVKAIVHGIDFDHASRSIVADYANKNKFRTRKSYVPEYKPDVQTEFSRLSASFNIADGKLNNKDLSMISDNVDITGSGNIDFIKSKLDYRPVVDIKVKNRTDIRDKLRDHPMEYRLQGDFENIKAVFELDKYELLVGRLLLQESKARRFRQMNTQKKKLW